MMPCESCPKTELLDQLASGTLPPDSEASLIDHLDRCENCRRLFDERSTDSRIVDALRDLPGGGGDSPLLHAALKKIKSDYDPWPPSPKHPNPEHPNPEGLSPDGLTGNDANDREALRWMEDGFEFVKVIGRGGMGIVYQARETSLDRLVAIKVLSPMFAADPSARERFLREARAAAAIKHPNVITIYAVADSRRLPNLVMEYVDGMSLQDRLDGTATFGVEEIVNVGSQVAAGLAAAHAKGVIHRDVKPANIMIESGTGIVKLSDFGLAQVAGQSNLTRTGMLVGTPAFMAPELLDQPGRHDHRADLFSLGSVLYAMCVGSSPFDAPSTLAILHRVSTAEPADLSDCRVEVPDWLQVIIFKLLEKNPDDRFQSATAAFEALQAGEGFRPAERPPQIDIKPVAAVKRKAHRRHRFRSSVIPLLFTAVAIALVFVGWLIRGNLSDDQQPIAASGNSGNMQAGVADDSGLQRPGGFLFDGSDGDRDTDMDEPELIIVDDDDMLEDFASLGETLEDVGDEARIVINSDGPFYLGPTFFDQSSITIAAGEGFHPVIHFVGGDDHDEEDEPLFISGGEMRLVGLEIRYTPSDNQATDRPLVASFEGELFIDRCRLVSDSPGCCVLAEGAHHVELTSCDLRAGAGSAILLTLQDQGQAHVTNCFLAGGTAIRAEVTDRSRILLKENSIIATRAIALEILDEIESPDLELRVEAIRNLFKSRDAVILFFDSISRSQFQRRLKWKGSDNLYSGNFVGVGDEEIEDLPAWGADLESWRDISQETNPAYSQSPLRLEGVELWKAILGNEMSAEDVCPADGLRVGELMVGATAPTGP